MSDDLQVRIDDGVLWLTMNRPDKLNALSEGMLVELRKQLEEAGRNRDVGAIVLTGAGRAFCAGGDVSAMAAGKELPGTLEGAVDKLREGQEACWLLHSLPKPTIAMVNGYAMGAGLGIALSCDLRVAADSAKFGTAYAKVGYGGDFGTSWQLTQLVGEAKAKELLWFADAIDAAEAHRINLVNKVVPAGDLEAAVRDWATRLAKGPRVSYRYMKENVNLAVRQDFRTILDREAFTHSRCGQTDDHKEGARAFVEKRPPVFQGK
ncbi:MAG: enoyl-CoA hydratase [Candidatus Hydrogenedentales bacterium]